MKAQRLKCERYVSGRVDRVEYREEMSSGE